LKNDSTLSRVSTKKETTKEIETPSSRNEKEKALVTEKDFRIVQVLKSGKNYRVYLVKRENEEKVYAMKLIGKKKMEKICISDQVSMEKDILERAKNPFIPKLEWYFENQKKIFFVMEFVEGGGKLKHILRKLSRFSEEITRFYSSEIILVLEYLHNDLQVSYNDVRLRNFLLDEQGHIKLLDYSQAKRLAGSESPKDTGNISSNTLKETNCTNCCEEFTDFQGLGFLIYEMLTGKKPFSEGGDDPATLEDVSPTSHLSWPTYVSKNAKDLVTRLISKDFGESLHFEDIGEIKRHPFFSQVNWEKMQNKSVYPPLVPAEYKGDSDEFEDLEDDDDRDDDGINTKCLKKPSLERIIEDISASYSEPDININAISFNRSRSRIGSVWGNH
jgi:serine/threonine protein kinase